VADDGGRTGDPPDSGPSRSRRAPDPLGRRALFWLPVDEEATAVDEAVGGRDPLGKRALFSAAPAVGPTEDAEHPGIGHGSIVVACSSCGAESRIGVLDFLIFQLPFGYWLPRGQFDHRMTCPSCRRRVWAGVTIKRA
jgi:hypothetical protein